ncbi:MAG: hypothetical protein ACK58J_01260, partial [Planctomyces sp.]
MLLQLVPAGDLSCRFGDDPFAVLSDFAQHPVIVASMDEGLTVGTLIAVGDYELCTAVGTLACEQ